MYKTKIKKSYPNMYKKDNVFVLETYQEVLEFDSWDKLLYYVGREGYNIFHPEHQQLAQNKVKQIINKDNITEELENERRN